MGQADWKNMSQATFLSDAARNAKNRGVNNFCVELREREWMNRVRALELLRQHKPVLG